MSEEKGSPSFVTKDATTPSLTSDSNSSPSAPTPSPSHPSSPYVDPNLHICSPPLNATITAQLQEFRRLLESDPVYQSSLYLRDYCTDAILHGFLRARQFDLPKSLRLLIGTLEWRKATLPDFITPMDVERDLSTGKMVIKGNDRWGRPVWVMDSSKDTTKKDHEAMIAHLFYTLEYCKRRMRERTFDGRHIEKYCLFIHLESYSMFTSPPMKTSMETLKTLVDRYPEHLGNAILYQPPLFFQVLWTACKPFMDQRTIGKIHFVRGDCSVGTKNNELIGEIVGADWRALCGVDDGKAEEKKTLYNHSEDFKALCDEHRTYVEVQKKKYGEDGKYNGESKQLDAHGDIPSSTQVDAASTTSATSIVVPSPSPKSSELTDTTTSHNDGGITFHSD